MAVIRFVARSVLVAAAFAASACGGDDGDDAEGTTGPSESPSPLSAAEVTDAYVALAEIGLIDFGVLLAVEADVHYAAQTSDLNRSRACARGGTLRTLGSSTVDQTTNGVSADYRLTHDNCQGASSISGRVWTFSGDPNLRVQFTARFDRASGALTLDGTMSGNLRYATTGTTGQCAASITFTANATGQSAIGTMCGRPVNERYDASGRRV